MGDVAQYTADATYILRTDIARAASMDTSLDSSGDTIKDKLVELSKYVPNDN